MQWLKVKNIKKKQDYETLQTRFEPTFPKWAPQLNVWSIQSQINFMQHCSAPEKKALKPKVHEMIESKEKKDYEILQARIEPKCPTWAP